MPADRAAPTAEAAGREGPYRQYFEDMPCYLSVHDRKFRIVDGNRRFREDFGGRLGEPCYEVYKGLDGVWWPTREELAAWYRENHDGHITPA